MKIQVRIISDLRSSELKQRIFAEAVKCQDGGDENTPLTLPNHIRTALTSPKQLPATRPHLTDQF